MKHGNVHITGNAVFGNVEMQGFRMATIQRNIPEERNAVKQLQKRWTADLKKRVEKSATLKAAFEATVVKAQPKGGTRNAPP
ncbi:hypothetical protein CYMTET_47004 [Cymbomonas tetramitiformis]|uniref:Uncharacterized protein n=1 Tax=Cymbomonas tetramitiformis TaxID=36881 RepID=A0AAE0BWL5_9CHLO|nr:hypothetical protein CYMTET_47004 [Cymbomonas tetramitiformis]